MIVKEIRSYPSPIPACDAQFNYLLDQRAKLSLEIKRLYRFDKNFLSSELGTKELGEFIESSGFIHRDMKNQMMNARGDYKAD